MSKLRKVKLWKILTGIILSLMPFGTAHAMDVKTQWSVGTGIKRESLELNTVNQKNIAGQETFHIKFKNVQFNTLSAQGAVLFGDAAKVSLGITHGVGSKHALLHLQNTQDPHNFKATGNKPTTTIGNIGLTTHLQLTDTLTLSPEIGHARGTTNYGQFNAELPAMGGGTTPFTWNAQFKHHATHAGKTLTYKICDQFSLSYGIFYHWQFYKSKKQFIADSTELAELILSKFNNRGFEHKVEGVYQIADSWTLTARTRFLNARGRNHKGADVNPGNGTPITQVTNKYKSWSADINLNHSF